MNVSEEAVEAAARAHYDSSPTYRATWVQLSAGHQRELMAPIRIALEAAAPHLTGAVWEEGYAQGHKHGYADCMKQLGHDTEGTAK